MKNEMDIRIRINNYEVTIHKLILKRDTESLEMYEHYQKQIERKVIKINLLLWVLNE